MKCAERRRLMHKHSLPSIEKFAAYLDGNLSQSELQQFSQMAEHDDALQELLNASSIVDDTIAGFSDADLQLPTEIANSDFELPDTENIDYLSLYGDSFSDKSHLYQQKGMNSKEIYQQGESDSSLADEIFDETDNNATSNEEVPESETGMDLDLHDNDLDMDLFDIDF